MSLESGTLRGQDRTDAARAERAPRCRFCGSTLRDIVVDLGMAPLPNRYLQPAELREAEPLYPLRTYVCRRCFLVQLEDLESPERLFGDYAYFSSYSETWLQHAHAYVTAVIERLGLSSASQVIEIASNDGYLLQYFAEKGIPALGIEPAANVAAEAIRKNIPTLVAFFNEELASRLRSHGRQADLVVANNVLAHVPDLNRFVRAMKVVLKPGGVVSAEFPHVMRLLQENQFDTIYPEHFSYFSLATIEKIFATHGLTIWDVEELPTHGGSLRIYASPSEHLGQRARVRVARLLETERQAGLTTLQAYLSFADRVRETKCSFLKFLIAAKRAGQTVVAYGAPAKGNTLLNYCGVRTELIEYTVDRNPHKQGRFLPGTHIPIYHPDKLRETRPDYVVILPWNLKEEIMDQMRHVREWGGRFVVPIPRTEVCS